MILIIDPNPGDKIFILSTMSFIFSQTKLINIEVSCVNFDQPLWIKAVRVSTSERVEVVSRLDPKWNVKHHIMYVFFPIQQVQNQIGH